MKHGVRTLLDRLDDGRRDLLWRYHALMLDRAVPLGLVAASDRARLMDRHVLDSLRGLACLGVQDRRIADLGSGAGLPGIPLAIAAPERRFTLVDPRSTRVAFLELVVDELSLANVTVVRGRAQEMPGRVETFEACTTRALSDAAGSWALARPLLAADGRLLYYAGRSWTAERSGDLLEGGPVVRRCDRADFPGHGPVVIIAASMSDGRDSSGAVAR